MSHERSIHDVVLPLISGKWGANGFANEFVEGTLFLIGKRGFALTAAHVVDSVHADPTSSASAFVNQDNFWVPLQIRRFESHHEEDVAIVELEYAPPPSWLVLSLAAETSPCEYEVWGFPSSIAQRTVKYSRQGQERPVLDCSKGQILQMIHRPFPHIMFWGDAFYELSAQAGPGCSGGPVLLSSTLEREHWSVCGIYSGQSVDADPEVGFAVRSEAICTWRPRILGRSVLEESQDH